MSNGFLTSSPVSRHGSLNSNYEADYVTAQRFTCPGSGTKELSEIGLWAYKHAGSARNIKLAVFTDDSTNTCPEAMVTNSESAALSVSSSSMAKNYHTYSTKPQVTGGVNYWLAFINDNDASNQISIDILSTSGKPTLYISCTYPTWPVTSRWHSYVDWSTSDMGIYAVYSDVTALPVFDYYYNNMRP